MAKLELLTGINPACPSAIFNIFKSGNHNEGAGITVSNESLKLLGFHFNLYVFMGFFFLYIYIFNESNNFTLNHTSKQINKCL